MNFLLLQRLRADPFLSSLGLYIIRSALPCSYLIPHLCAVLIQSRLLFLFRHLISNFLYDFCLCFSFCYSHEVFSLRLSPFFLPMRGPFSVANEYQTFITQPFPPPTYMNVYVLKYIISYHKRDWAGFSCRRRTWSRVFVGRAGEMEFFLVADEIGVAWIRMG